MISDSFPIHFNQIFDSLQVPACPTHNDFQLGDWPWKSTRCFHSFNSPQQSPLNYHSLKWAHIDTGDLPPAFQVPLQSLWRCTQNGNIYKTVILKYITYAEDQSNNSRCHYYEYLLYVYILHIIYILHISWYIFSSQYQQNYDPNSFLNKAWEKPVCLHGNLINLQPLFWRIWFTTKQVKEWVEGKKNPVLTSILSADALRGSWIFKRALKM